MILEVIRIGLLRLWHGRIEMLLTFVVPIVFFTIFALIFDKQVGDTKSKSATTTAVDLDGSPASRKLIDRLAADELTRFDPIADDHGAATPIAALEEARRRIVGGEALVAVVVPEGWADELGDADAPGLQLLADTSDPIAPRMVSALLQQLAGDVLAENLPPTGGVLERGVADSTAAEPPAAVGWPTPPSLVDAEPMDAASPAATPPRPSLPQPPVVATIDLLSGDKSNPVVSMYAAGIAVMFLLFSATGAGGSLLDEEENQTLERLMGSGLGMTRLLIGKWIGLVIIGAAQVTVMFVWAQAVFGVDLTDHLGGFALMTLATSAAAASLALVLAAACRTRAQLNAVSVILILTMSALGGSMVPRYVMSESMQQWGRLTFNAWAIDGYEKLFWRDLPTVELAPELLVLGGSAIGLLMVARLLATRWETA